ncbi:MAG: Rieske 2Fe-2S domain-containing protein [Gammaproteobacteria bacterium]|nr:Rieske 2Fe-2S domain-containing protein [Gammaproteobacteria bacterium]
MAAASDELKRAMPYTTRYPELGTGPIDVAPLIDPDLFELEKEKIFRKTWLLVGREEEIPEPGDYKVRQIDVASTSVIVVRDKTGKINAFHNLCTHRGNKIIQEEGAQTTGRTRSHLMTCRFHAWSFSTDGKLHGVPKEENFNKLDKNCLGLKTIHCEQWQGFIFINLDKTPEKNLVEYLEGMADQFAGYPYHESTVSYRYSTVLNCNWKVAMYAFSEGYHVPTIHAATLPSLAKIEQIDYQCFGPHSTSALYVPPVAGMQPTPATGNLGGRLVTSKQHGPHLDLLPEKINPERRTDFQFEFPVFFPNLVLHLGAGNGYPGMTYFHHQFWPLSVGQTLWEGTNYFRPPKTPSERVAIAHTNALHRNAWLEDTSTMEDTYAALCSGALDEMVLMDEEIMIRNTHRAWHEYMGV